jgi:hypothetical protein
VGWDLNLSRAFVDTMNGQLVLEYQTDGNLKETVEVKYMGSEGRFIISEVVTLQPLQTYNRVWVVQQVQNRPYHIRVVLLA